MYNTETVLQFSSKKQCFLGWELSVITLFFLYAKLTLTYLYLFQRVDNLQVFFISKVIAKKKVTSVRIAPVFTQPPNWPVVYCEACMMTASHGTRQDGCKEVTRYTHGYTCVIPALISLTDDERRCPLSGNHVKNLLQTQCGEMRQIIRPVHLLWQIYFRELLQGFVKGKTRHT